MSWCELFVAQLLSRRRWLFHEEGYWWLSTLFVEFILLLSLSDSVIGVGLLIDRVVGPFLCHGYHVLL